MRIEEPCKLPLINIFFLSFDIASIFSIITLNQGWIFYVQPKIIEPFSLSIATYFSLRLPYFVFTRNPAAKIVHVNTRVIARKPHAEVRTPMYVKSIQHIDIR